MKEQEIKEKNFMNGNKQAGKNKIIEKKMERKETKLKKKKDNKTQKTQKL